MTQNDERRPLLTTARMAGIWYLVMAVSGLVGFMVLHSRIYISDDPEKTLANLTGQENLSRVRLLFELLIVIAQALTAVWFYRLFRSISEWGAWAVGAWGMMNSAAIMISAMSMGSVIEIANSSIPSHEDKILLIQLLGRLAKHAWGVGSVFFGLWLIPMGYIVIRSKRMPVGLGWVLITGGAGYLLQTFLSYGGFTSSFLDLLVMPATVGEFWMIGYLLIYGIRPERETAGGFAKEEGLQQS